MTVATFTVTTAGQDPEFADRAVIAFAGGRRLAIRCDRIRIAPHNGACHLEILNERGQRRGVYCAVSHLDASKLMVAGVAMKEKPVRVKRERWREGEFEIASKDGPRRVWGWMRGPWGIELYEMDGDDVAVDPDVNPKPSLTQLRSGRSVSACAGVGNLKRLANWIDDNMPELATAEKASDLGPEKADLVREMCGHRNVMGKGNPVSRFLREHAD